MTAIKYDEKTKQHIFTLFNAGHTRREIADQLGIPRSTVGYLVQGMVAENRPAPLDNLERKAKKILDLDDLEKEKSAPRPWMAHDELNHAIDSIINQRLIERLEGWLKEIRYGTTKA